MRGVNALPECVLIMTGRYRGLHRGSFDQITKLDCNIGNNKPTL